MSTSHSTGSTTSSAIGARGHVIRGGSIQISNTPVRIGGPTGPSVPAGKPEVELLDGGRQIRVRCGCGETILIDCQFPEQS